MAASWQFTMLDSILLLSLLAWISYDKRCFLKLFCCLVLKKLALVSNRIQKAHWRFYIQTPDFLFDFKIWTDFPDLKVLVLSDIICSIRYHRRLSHHYRSYLYVGVCLTMHYNIAWHGSWVLVCICFLVCPALEAQTPYQVEFVEPMINLASLNPLICSRSPLFGDRRALDTALAPFPKLNPSRNTKYHTLFFEKKKANKFSLRDLGFEFLLSCMNKILISMLCMHFRK